MLPRLPSRATSNRSESSLLRAATCLLGALSFLAIASAPAGCSSAGSPGKAPAHTAAKTGISTLNVILLPGRNPPTGIGGIQGSYHGCSGQTDGTSWVLDTSGNFGFMEGLTGLSGPSVDLNDGACALQVDSINTASTAYASANLPTALVFTGPSVTPNTYLETAVGFVDPKEDAGNSLSFYANAESTVTDATGAFVLTLLVGDSPSAGSSSATATVSVVSGSVSSVGDVQAPNYTVGFSLLTLEDGLTGVVGTVSGDISFVVNAQITQAAEAVNVFNGGDLSTASFAQIDALWQATDFSALAANDGSIYIPGQYFLNVGDQLPKTSSAVFQHVDGASHVATYDVIAITFLPSGS
jgi:hypothetical protein